MMSHMSAQDIECTTLIAARMHVQGRNATNAMWMDSLVEKGDGGGLVAWPRGQGGLLV
jgi:hypothetical protein